MGENILLDESPNEKLDQLQLEGLKYRKKWRKHEKHLQKYCKEKKTILQKSNN